MTWGRLAAPNHRGVLVPRVLGLWEALGVCVAALGLATSLGLGAAGWAATSGALLVFGAGLMDDLAPAGPRGLRNHLRALAAAQVTTGIVKAFVAVGAAVVVVAVEPRRGASVELAGVVLIAAATNLWNGLDVMPGRALKAFLVVGLLFIGVDWRLAPPVPGAFVPGLLAVFADLRERAMLGDGGSNLLGFTVGLGLYLVFPGWGVALGAAAAVALNLLAETVTLSRLIEATPPLRWFDGLGRIRLGP
jgi:hypothetical protein